jgi:hypothetical protein
LLKSSAPKRPAKESSTDVILKRAPFPTVVLDVETRLAWLLMETVSPAELNVRGVPSMAVTDFPGVCTSFVVIDPCAMWLCRINSSSGYDAGVVRAALNSLGKFSKACIV